MRKKRPYWRSTGLFRLDPEQIYKLLAFTIGFLIVFKDPMPRGVTLLQALSVFAVILLLLTRRRVPLSQEARIYIVGLLLAVTWFLATTLLGGLRQTSDLTQGIRDLRDFLFFVFLGSAFALLARTPSGWEPLMWGGALGMAAEVGLRTQPGIYAVLFNPPVAGVRYVGGFISPNEYSAFASIVLAAAVWCALNRDRHRWLYVGISLLSVYVLLTTYSRGGLAGAALGVGAALLVSYRRLLRPSNLVVAALLAIGLLVVVGQNEASLARFSRRLTLEHLLAGLQSREALAASGWEIATRYPVFGAGWGGFSELNLRYGGTGTASPHNELVKAATDSGLVGVVAMLFILLYPLRVLQKRGYLHTPLFPMIVAFFAAEVFFSHLVRPNLSLVFALLLGSVFAVQPSALRQKPGTQTDGRQPGQAGPALEAGPVPANGLFSEQQ